MTMVRVNVFLEDDDKIVAERMKSGTLAIDIGKDATIYIQSNSAHYDRFVDLFVQKETAPGDQPETAPEQMLTHNPILGDHSE